MAYDADNQLRGTSRSGTSVRLAYDAAGALLRRYVHGPGVDEPMRRCRVRASA